MFTRFSRCLWVCLILCLAAAPAARAQWAVVDVGAIVQLDSSVAASQSIDFGDSYYDAGGTPTLRLLDPTLTVHR